MANQPKLLDRWGNPVRRSELSQEVAAPTFGGVRSPITGYPADGLNPMRLAAILKEADQGDPLRYLELAEAIEERDPHYLGVLQTRKRAISQLEITVEEGGDTPLDVEMAERVRTWLKRDELTEELFDILDAIGKGYSFTEIIWTTSSGQWEPKQLDRRDPRWFRFARHDLQTPLMLDRNGEEGPLPPFRIIYAQLKAKSGIALRSGIARVAAWSWMFKAFTQRDWAIFTQTYAQPLRVGKYGPGATEDDRNKLFQAVANIAGDCAAIVPESMMIEFVETANLGSSSDLYEKRADWLDRQTSKLVLGQTATTDAEVGGLGSGKEHREVQEDIERADARMLAAILNRDLIQPWMQLDYGPQKAYPRLVIARPEAEDLAKFSSALAPLLAQGLRVKQSEVLDKFGLSEPTESDKVIGGGSLVGADPAENPPASGEESAPKDRGSILKRESGVFKGGSDDPGGETAAQAESPSAALSAAPSPVDLLAARLEDEAAPAMARMMGQVEAMLQAAGSLDEFAEMLRAGFGEIDDAQLVRVLADAMAAAHAGGRATVEEEAGRIGDA